MSLDISLVCPHCKHAAASENITHNLGAMAQALGIYDLVWHAKGVGTAADLIVPVEGALAKLKADPERYRKFEAENGWGTVEGFIDFLGRLLVGCRADPGLVVEVCR